MDPISPDALVAHEAFVLKLARRLTQDEASAQDLRQDTLVTALEARPRDRSLRGWLAATLRSRKVDQERRDAARRRREDAAARPESLVCDSAAQLEQLELNHSVVQAVLELEEPYRSVVTAVYYEGLTPREIAQRAGGKSATVRSQLSRAHAQLRERLDQQHGQRSAWALPLTGLLGREQGGAATAGKAGAAAATAGATVETSGVALPLGGWSALAVGATALVTAGAWWVINSSDHASVPAAIEVPLPQELASSVELEPAADGGLRSVASAATSRQPVGAQQTEGGEDAAADPFAEKLPDLLERVRRLRWEILQRALSIRPELAERYSQQGERVNVVRLLNRERFGMDWSLPWMQGGGGFYSFSQRSHDARRWRQVSFMGERLYLEARRHVGVALGPMALDFVPSTSAWAGAALSADKFLEYDAAWTANRAGLADHRGSNYVVPEVGHSYLLRLAQEEDFDILVACEVLERDDEGCTLAWRLLREWPVAGRETGVDPDIEQDEPGARPEGLPQLGDEALREQLAHALDRARELLFESPPARIEADYGSLRTEPGSGLARLLAFEGAWAELMAGEGHGAEISPLSGAHDEQHAYLGFRLENGHGELTPSMAATVGLVCDLGSVPLDEVTLRGVAASGDEKAKLVLDPWLGASPPYPADPEAAQRKADRYWSEVRSAFPQRLENAGFRPHARALVGHSYLVRSVHHSERNLLFAVHVASLDAYGAIVAWRVIDDSPGWPYR